MIKVLHLNFNVNLCSLRFDIFLIFLVQSLKSGSKDIKATLRTLVTFQLVKIVRCFDLTNFITEKRFTSVNCSKSCISQKLNF